MGRTRKNTNSRFANLLSVIINTSDSVGVDAINLVRVAFTSVVDNIGALSRSLCIIQRQLLLKTIELLLDMLI